MTKIKFWKLAETGDAQRSKKYRDKMSKKSSDLDKVIPTAFAFINNHIQPDGILDAETHLVVVQNAKEIMKSADSSAVKIVKSLTELEAYIGDKKKDGSVKSQHKFQKLDKVPREELDDEIFHLAEAQVFLQKKKRLLDESQMFMALDMTKRICVAHLGHPTTAPAPLPEILQSLTSASGLYQGQFAGGGGKSSSAGGGGSSAGGGGLSSIGTSLGDLDLNGEEALQPRNQPLTDLFSQLASSPSFGDQMDNITVCDNCKTITSPLHILTNPFSEPDFWALCDDCASVYHK